MAPRIMAACRIGGGLRTKEIGALMSAYHENEGAHRGIVGDAKLLARASAVMRFRESPKAIEATLYNERIGIVFVRFDLAVDLQGLADHGNRYRRRPACRRYREATPYHLAAGLAIILSRRRRGRKGVVVYMSAAAIELS